MEADPKLEGADLQLRAARFDYRQLATQLAHRNLRFESVRQYEFAEECFHAAEKTIRVRSKRAHHDVELEKLWASTYQARIAVLRRLSGLSRWLKIDPSLEGADAIRWICAMPKGQRSVLPGARAFGFTDGLLIISGLVMLTWLIWHL